MKKNDYASIALFLAKTPFIYYMSFLKLFLSPHPFILLIKKHQVLYSIFHGKRSHCFSNVFKQLLLEKTSIFLVKENDIAITSFPIKLQL